MALLLLGHSLMAAASGRPPGLLVQRLTPLLPVLGATAVARMAPWETSWPGMLGLFVGLGLASEPALTRSTWVRRGCEEGLWFGGLCGASTLGLWPLTAGLLLFLWVFTRPNQPELALQRSLVHQMSTTETTLRHSQRQFQADRQRLQQAMTRAQILDEFQAQALQAEGPEPFALLLRQVAARLAPDFPVHIGRDAGTVELGCGWHLGWLGPAPSEPPADPEQEALVQLIARARLILRILEQNGRLASLVREKSLALERLAESQAQLVQSEKLVAMGQLAAGVAHEINSPLAAIRLQAQMGQRRLKKNDAEGALRSLETCEQASLRAKAIIDSLLASASYSDGHREPTLLADLVPQALRMLEAHAEERAVEVRTQIASLAPLTVNPQEILQILTNILLNALDALQQRPEGRKILVSTLPAPEGGGQSLTVANNGPPLDPVTLDRLFDPFYTTKEIGQGTGLGLSIAYQLARAHGGRIEAKNHQGWVHFTVWLPESATRSA